MGQYAYDETGGIFNYFLLSILSIVLMPTTLAWIMSLFQSKASISKKDHHGDGDKATTDDDPDDTDGDEKTEKTKSKEKGSVMRPCSCKPCEAKRARFEKLKKANSSSFPFRPIFFILGWIMFAYVAHQVYNSPPVDTGLWNPYEILGVDESASASQIKSAFRKLSLKYHPDKVAEEDKDESAKIFIEISKAHTVLTDDEARATFDEFGHPDGKQAMTLGIALPKWLVESKNNLFVLFIYGAVFGFGLPFYVARWWYNAKNVSGEKIQHATMARFYKEVKDTTNPRVLMELVSKCNELLTTIPYRQSEKKQLEEIGAKINQVLLTVGDSFDPKKKITTVEAAISHKILILLLAHLCNVPIDDPILKEEQESIIVEGAHVAPGMLQIAAARFWLNVALYSIDIRQAIVQGCLPQKGSLSQLPHLTIDMIKRMGNNKKCPVTTIRQLLELSDQERKDTLRDLTDGQRDELIMVAKQYPILRVRKAQFSVVGEPVITPGSIVTLVVKFELISPAELRRERREGAIPLDTTREEPPKKKAWFEKEANESGAALGGAAHSPRFPADRPAPVWWILLADRNTGRLICLGKVTDLGASFSGGLGASSELKTARLQFQAPPNSGVWNFHVYVKCDSVMGCDATLPVKLVVENPTAEMEMDNEDDEISEPDEDTIAGQMNAIRSGKALGGGGGGGASGSAGEKTKKRQKPVRGETEDSSDSDDASDADYESDD